ncbi:putative metallo-hydrolase YflN [Bacillus sp. THAF10]|uniref:MBL fold metallo-hydrolase n=1 Tax=Bacillus sp. THAF10 TaxID=2587848 RepID=UPI0012680FFE|nr:MBL fold metallo-hydrolase [Bacillus sp. THAF10]QFT89613.1 putative metallo-hydrolase YflN [Bacillus sp. THAF10]
MNEVSCKQEIKQITIPTPFAVGDVHTYIIITDKITLVDAGVKTHHAWEVFQQELQKHGLKVLDIDQVVITHHHPDHVGLLDYLPVNIPVYGHKRAHLWMTQDQRYFSAHESYYKKLFKEIGVEERFYPLLNSIDKPLRFACHRGLTAFIGEGDRIEGLPNWRIIETPGHASSHIVLFDEKSGILIGGDLILADISPNPLVEPPYPGEAERKKAMLEYVQSIEKMMELPITRVLPGHGEIVGDVPALLSTRMLQQEKRARKVVEFVSKQPSTAYEICQFLFKSVYEKQLLLTLSETIGQLDYLLDKGLITEDNDTTPFVYQAGVREE